MIQAAIFDMDGTVLNTLFDLKESVNFALEKLNFTPCTQEKVRKSVGNGVVMLAKRVLPENVDDELVYEWIKIFKKHYAENMYDNTSPYEDIINTIKILRNKGIKIAIVSNKFELAVQELTEKYFKGLVDISVGQSDDIPPKPSPLGVQKVLKELNVKDAVFIGDSDVDIMTAKNANLPVIGVSWGFRDKDNLKGADFIAQKPQELISILDSMR